MSPIFKELIAFFVHIASTISITELKRKKVYICNDMYDKM